MSTNEDILQQIIVILKSKVSENIKDISTQTDLVNDLGLDSLKVMEILELVEDHFDISIPINILPGVRTVGDLVVGIKKIIDND